METLTWESFAAKNTSIYRSVRDGKIVIYHKVAATIPGVTTVCIAVRNPRYHTLADDAICGFKTCKKPASGLIQFDGMKIRVCNDHMSAIKSVCVFRHENMKYAYEDRFMIRVYHGQITAYIITQINPLSQRLPLGDNCNYCGLSASSDTMCTECLDLADTIFNTWWVPRLWLLSQMFLNMSGYRDIISVIISIAGSNNY